VSGKCEDDFCLTINFYSKVLDKCAEEDLYVATDAAVTVKNTTGNCQNDNGYS
jgi:hypothetical protein